jgi:hypothetical protein
VGDQVHAGQASLQLALLAQRTGRWTDARSLVEESRQIAIHSGQAKLEGDARSRLGVIRAEETMEARMREVRESGGVVLRELTCVRSHGSFKGICRFVRICE